MENFKTELVENEFNEIKDLVCEAILHKTVEHKQFLLIKIGAIMVGSEKKFLESAESQGYNIDKGLDPNESF